MVAALPACMVFRPCAAGVKERSDGFVALPWRISLQRLAADALYSAHDEGFMQA